MRRLAPKTAAARYLQQEFPQCTAAFLAGSAASGRHTAWSDLDLLIIDGTAGVSFQYNCSQFGWLIESFVLTPETVTVYFEEARQQAMPTLIRLCAEGIVLAGGGQAAEIQEAAREFLANGPEEWAFAEIERARYDITDCLDDLEGSLTAGESAFTVMRLSDLLVRFILRTNGCWLGAGKWACRELQRFDPVLCGEYLKMLDIYYREGAKEPLIAFADRILDEFGGRLREGWIGSGAPGTTD